MEILSDAVFKGNVSISGGNFSVTLKGESVPLLQAKKDQYGNSLLINVSEFVDNTNISNDAHIFGNAVIDGYLHVDRHISLKNGDSIANWSDLNNILNFAPKSLSTTVNSNTTKINSACSTISSLCTKVNSLCTTVAGIQPYTKHMFSNPGIPVGCTKFYFEEKPHLGSKEYKFIINDQVNFAPSLTKVFKLGDQFEEVQMDVKQYYCFANDTRWFEGTLSSNTSGILPTEFILVFDEFKELCTTETVPQ